MSLSITVIAGNVGREPKVRELSGGKKVASFSVAVNSRGKINGQWQKTTEWYNVTCFGQTAEFASQYIKKGQMVICIGEIRLNKWVNKNGETLTNLEMTANTVKSLGGRTEAQTDERDERGGSVNDLDEIPF